MERLNRLVESGPFEVHIAGIYPLEEIAEAEEAVGKHHLGKVLLRIG